jgi:hypothetical protein
VSYLTAVFKQRLEGSRLSSFSIDSEKRLCSRRPDQQPGIVAHMEFDSIAVTNALHLELPDVLGNPIDEPRI